jgi:hypothetical protein
MIILYYKYKEHIKNYLLGRFFIISFSNLKESPKLGILPGWELLVGNLFLSINFLIYFFHNIIIEINIDRRIKQSMVKIIFKYINQLIINFV